MYYRGVNRGLYATSPGKYTTALIMALGLFAIASGYNAIYLSLSLGMAIIVISGIQSERVIRSHEVLSFRDAVTDAGGKFHLEFHVANLSREYPVYGVDSFVPATFDFPKSMGDKVEAAAKGRTLALQPGESRWILAESKGFRRGIYPELKVVQKTIFPFGLIAKFKYATVAGSLTVLPKWDSELAEELRRVQLQSHSESHEPEGFHHHRRFTGREPLSFIDWKKSAGKQTEDWAVKTFEKSTREGILWVVPQWEEAFLNSIEFESFLSRVRTVAELVSQIGGEWAFLTKEGGILQSTFEVRRYLAALPAFERYSSGPVRLPAGLSKHRQVQVGARNVNWGRTA